ncbi:DNA replication licensing factor, mcm4 component [Homalodisca vitripennis]|nr:DNA replication licensing factor, mcm4 component [Homalodisca vitripennis]
MSSPRRTPRRSARGSEADQAPRTPQQPVEPRTPSSRTRRGPRTPAREDTSPRSGTPTSTPLRFGAQRAPPTDQDNVVVEPSDPLSIPPSSPAQNIGAPTSPFGVGMSEIDLSSPLNYGTPSSMGSLRTPRSGIRGTPIRLRPDIRTDRRMRQVNVNSDPVDVPVDRIASSEGEGASQGPNLVIWGTDVVVSRCKDRFKRFIQNFLETETDEDEQPENRDTNEPLYMQKLEEIHMLEEPFLNVNCGHLETFDPELYRQLVCYPQEVIPTLDMAVNEMFFDRHPAAVLEHQIQVRPFNAQKTKNMRLLNPEDIDQLISVSGMVTRTSNIMPEMREAFFKCMVCANTASVEIDRGRIAEPTVCTQCSTKFCFTLVHNRSQFTDKQMVKLQESPECPRLPMVSHSD